MGTLTEIASSEFYALQIDAQNQHSLSAKNVTISVTWESNSRANRNENNSSDLAYLMFIRGPDASRCHARPWAAGHPLWGNQILTVS